MVMENLEISGNFRIMVSRPGNGKLKLKSLLNINCSSSTQLKDILLLRNCTL